MKNIFTIVIIILTTTFFTQTQNAKFGGCLSIVDTVSDRAVDVITDDSGNIFTANVFILTATFNSVMLIGAPKGIGTCCDNSLLIKKLNPIKVIHWCIRSNQGVENSTSMSNSPAGDFIVTGNISSIASGETFNANIINTA